VTLLLQDGSSIAVPSGDQTVAWCLFNVNISARGRLDYSNLSALGSVGQTLVCSAQPVPRRCSRQRLAHRGHGPSELAQ